MSIIKNVSQNRDCNFSKFIIAGTVNLGKSLFMKKIKLLGEGEIEFNEIYDNYKPTIGAEFTIFNYEINNHLFRIQIWDIAGREQDKNKIFYFARGADTILIFYNSYDRYSFDEAKKIYLKCYELYPKSIYALISGKYDSPLKNQNKDNDFVSDEEALEFAYENNIIFSHISNSEKYDNGINQLLKTIFLKLIKIHENKLL